jgi:hypothetical protein
MENFKKVLTRMLSSYGKTNDNLTILKNVFSEQRYFWISSSSYTNKPRSLYIVNSVCTHPICALQQYF